MGERARIAYPPGGIDRGGSETAGASDAYAYADADADAANVIVKGCVRLECQLTT
jgi:hypothetical protein